jgi:hypothetical protein
MTVNPGFLEVHRRQFGTRSWICRAFEGRLVLPGGAWEQPPHSAGFPPALIPIWGSGLTYIGLWKHWFGTRSPSFVRVSIEDAFRVDEIAMSEEQLVAVVALQAVCAAEGIDGELERFASEVQFEALPQVLGCAEATGDDIAGLRTLSMFAGNLPAESRPLPHEYLGTFPTEHEPPKRGWNSVTPLECQYRLPADRPIWFDDPIVGFEGAMERGNLQSAWLCMNSHGWSYGAAKGALTRLSLASGDLDFNRLRTAWCAEQSEEFGGF